jgi:hypothetical protein
VGSYLRLIVTCIRPKGLLRTLRRVIKKKKKLYLEARVFLLLRSHLGHFEEVEESHEPHGDPNLVEGLSFRV